MRVAPVCRANALRVEPPVVKSVPSSVDHRLGPPMKRAMKSITIAMVESMKTAEMHAVGVVPLHKSYATGWIMIAMVILMKVLLLEANALAWERVSAAMADGPAAMMVGVFVVDSIDGL